MGDRWELEYALDREAQRRYLSFLEIGMVYSNCLRCDRYRPMVARSRETKGLVCTTCVIWSDEFLVGP